LFVYEIINLFILQQFNMNYSTIDLNIDNYDDADLEGFFNLNKKYEEPDVVSKEASIRNKILNTDTDESFKRNFLIFLDEVKRLLIQKIKKKPLSRGDGSNFVIDKSGVKMVEIICPIINLDPKQNILDFGLMLRVTI